MARQKKVEKFDFSGFKHYDELWKRIRMYEPDDSVLIGEIGAFIAAHPDHNDYWLKKNYERLKEAGSFDKSNLQELQQRNVVQVLLTDPQNKYRQRIDKEFLEWYDGHEGAQELYKEVSQNRYYFYDETMTGIYNAHEAQAKFTEWKARPAWAHHFESVVSDSNAKYYIEKNREQKFEEGDLVVLRKPFVGNYDYDPHYRNDTMKPEDLRYGTVMAANTGTINRHSRGGRGSREVNVMWFGKNGDIVGIPERCLKWESRKRTV
jgi:hypothetical protein